jgi:L-proline---[L-prolyl-carrier protein] ligase
MVKIRGLRVELGEVEAALLTHPDIAEAAVAAVGSGIEARLVAGSQLAWLEPKRHCAERLPRHMIVDNAIFLDPLPRTRNGKVDRLTSQRMTADEVTK